MPSESTNERLSNSSKSAILLMIRLVAGMEFRTRFSWMKN